MIHKLILIYLLVKTVKTEPEISQECIVDTSLTWDAPDNYVDCTSEENEAEGTTSCCKQQDQIGCCKGDKWENIIQVATIIGSCTLTLALLMFAVMWCNPNTFPCIRKFKYKVQTKYRKWEENSCCCKKKVERKRQEEKAADIPQYELDKEMQGEVDNSFWGPV